MNPSLKHLALAVLCTGAAGLSLAAQPGAAPATTPQRAPVTPSPLVLASTGPGNLTGFKALAAEVVANQPISFRFEGSGHCKLSVNGGDGYSRDYEGKLPFNAGYTYSTGSMSSFQAFKDYSASVKPSGDCKLASALPAVTVRVNNPSPQGVPASGSQGPVISSAKTTLTLSPPKP